MHEGYLHLYISGGGVTDIYTDQKFFSVQISVFKLNVVKSFHYFLLFTITLFSLIYYNLSNLTTKAATLV